MNKQSCDGFRRLDVFQLQFCPICSNEKFSVLGSLAVIGSQIVKRLKEIHRQLFYYTIPCNYAINVVQ